MTTHMDGVKATTRRLVSESDLATLLWARDSESDLAAYAREVAAELNIDLPPKPEKPKAKKKGAKSEPKGEASLLG